MKFVLFFLLFLVSELRANPFLPALAKKESSGELFFKQIPPFKYPFNQSSELNDFKLILDKIPSLLGPNKLVAYEEMFKDFKYDTKLNLYAYDFAVGEHWDILPHPLVTETIDIKANEWISEFNNELTSLEGIQSLSFDQQIDEISGTEAYAGNKVELLKTPLSLKKIISQLEASKDHVFMSSFLFQCDAGSAEILNLMEKKINQGVEIYLVIDKIFTLADRNCVKRLKKMGVQLALQGGLTGIFHEKMYVFDGEYAIVDGQNLAGVQTLSNGHNNLFNDMAIGVKGPMVQEVAHRFLYHWNRINKKQISEKLAELYATKRLEAVSLKSDQAIEAGLLNQSGVCRLVTQNPGFKGRKILPLYFAYAQNAKNYLFFNQIDHRFQDVGGNGVGKKFLKELVKIAHENKNLRVDMLTNQWKLPTDIALIDGMGINGNLFTFMITKPGLLVLERPHEQIGTAREKLIPLLNGEKLHWWASATYMHAKTMMIDNIATMIGSYNINAGSENFSYEQVMICHDHDLAQKMQKSIVQDLLNSIPIPLK